MSVKTPYLIADLAKDLGIISKTLHSKAVATFLKNAAARNSLTSSGLAGALGGLTSGGAKGLLTSSTKLLSLSLDTAFTVVGAIWTVGTFLSARKKRKAAQRKQERSDYRQKEINENRSKIDDVIMYSRTTGRSHPSELGSALEGNLDYDKSSTILNDYAKADIRQPLVNYFKQSKPGDEQSPLQTTKEKEDEEKSKIPLKR